MRKLHDFFRKDDKDKHLAYLRNTITENMTLVDIVSVFEKMCQMPYEGSMYLWETGTFSFQGSPMFSISLVRQYPDNEDEYSQLHIDISYEPTEENAVFSESVWDVDLEETLCSYIRTSKAYEWAKDVPIHTVEIFMDKT